MSHEPIIEDFDFRLFCGDSRDVVRDLAARTIDCVVTSPPYYGLRDYGTGRWDGGDREDCEHEGARKKTRYDYSLATSRIQDGSRTGTDATAAMYRNVCPECGAKRIDSQLGQEDSPEDFVRGLVSLFENLIPALAEHATVWVNLGDSYHQGELRGIPWRFAFAMQEAGFRLMRDVIWYKRDPMPESAKTRPTTTHEYIFMFGLSKRAYYDWYAVRENAVWASDPRNGQRVEYDGKRDGMLPGTGQQAFVSVGDKRLLRSVWDITTVTYPGAHFATFPPELPRRCIEAGCPPSVCTKCGEPRRRIVEGVSLDRNELPADHPEWRPDRYDEGKAGDAQAPGPGQRYSAPEDLGWTDCGCRAEFRPGMVLDPFLGSGTTSKVARDLGRHSVGIELNPEYCGQIGSRTSQLSIHDLEAR